MTLKKCYTDESGQTLYKCSTLLFLAWYGSDEISIADSFNSDGTYVFTPYEPMRDGQYKNIVSICNELQASFLWIDNPSSTNTKCFRIQCDKNTGVRSVARTSAVGLDRYRVFIRSGASVLFQDDAFEFNGTNAVTFQSGGVALKSDVCKLCAADGTLYFYATNLNKIQATETGMAGTTTDDTDYTDILALMDVKIEYAMPLDKKSNAGTNESAESTPLDRALQGYVMSRSNNVLHGEVTEFTCSFNPILPYDPKYTYLQLGSGITVESGLTTTQGYSIPLTATDDAKLVVNKGVSYLRRENNNVIVENYDYLSPHGRFAIKTDTSAFDEIKILCGLSGCEYVSFKKELIEKGQGFVDFYSGSPAFYDETDTQNALTDKSTTAYLGFSDGALYISQSNDLPLYGELGQNYMGFLGIASKALGGTSNVYKLSVMPYVSSKGTLESARLESGLINARRKTLEALHDAIMLEKACALEPIKAQANENVIGVNANGMAVSISEDARHVGQWTWFGLANTTAYPQTMPNMRLSSVSPRLRYRLQTGDARIFFKEKSEILDYASVNSDYDFSIDGFTFKTSPDYWRESESGPKTAMALQFSRGKAMSEWLKNEPLFNKSVEMAYNSDGTLKPRYSEFIDVVNDPDFQGIVLFNANLGIDRSYGSYMTDLLPLFDSIDKDKLYIHHVIIYKSRLDIEESAITFNQSNISALVDYIAENEPYDPNASTPDYAFKAVELSITVKKREIEMVTSKSELLINKLLFSNCKNDDGNIVYILGRLQRDEGGTFYSYCIEKMSEFALSGSMVSTVSIDTVTITATLIESVFHIGGRFSFEKYEQADILSFGRESQELMEQNYGLKFENLCIVMKKNKDGIVDMQPHYSSIILRARDSIKRKGSFADRFPAHAERFTVGREDDTPRGFVSIETPVAQEKLQAPWLGFEYDIPIGSLGDLSGGESLYITLMAAWTPDADTPKRYFGAHLPGADMLRLQNVFDIGFATVSLDVKDGNYRIIMHQFAISVLSLKFPPGENKLYLYSDDTGQKIGWYMTYAGD